MLVNEIPNLKDNYLNIRPIDFNKNQIIINTLEEYKTVIVYLINNLFEYNYEYVHCSYTGDTILNLNKNNNDFKRFEDNIYKFIYKLINICLVLNHEIKLDLFYEYNYYESLILLLKCINNNNFYDLINNTVKNKLKKIIFNMKINYNKPDKYEYEKDNTKTIDIFISNI